jgi:two-component system OmpR family sensor kinase
MRRWWIWPAGLIPAGIGLGLALWLQSREAQPPLLHAYADLGTLLLLAGLLLSAAILWPAGLWELARRRQERAVAAERAAAAAAHRRFVGRLEHELKNPLTAMRAGLANVASELQAAPGGETEQQEALATVVGQAERLGRLAADLRKLAEVEAQPLERTAVDVADLLEEVVDAARQKPAAAERRLALSLPRAPWPLPPVAGDRDLLFLAIYNLLDNALKFTRGGDTVEVRAAEDGAAVVVEVADTGAGVPAEELPHLFEELYRGQGARGIEGSGLGLALVRAIIERHGGRVAVRSRPGQGSVFSLRLPASELRSGGGEPTG